MPLLFKSRSHGQLPFGFFNIEIDMLLLDRSFFFAEEFCRAVVELARTVAAGEPRMEAIILSMTPAERRNPKLLDGNRRKRIANGSGTSVQEVNQLMKQFGQMNKMMKTLKTTLGSQRQRR